MSNDPLSAKEDYDRGIAAARADETERCALLCEALATVHRVGAAKVRNDGSYTVRALWPPFKKTTVVRLGFERQAQVRDAAVQTLTTMAKCIRAGYDPRKLEPGHPVRPMADHEALKTMRC